MRTSVSGESTNSASLSTVTAWRINRVSACLDKVKHCLKLLHIAEYDMLDLAPCSWRQTEKVLCDIRNRDQGQCKYSRCSTHTQPRRGGHSVDPSCCDGGQRCRIGLFTRHRCPHFADWDVSKAASCYEFSHREEEFEEKYRSSTYFWKAWSKVHLCDDRLPCFHKKWYVREVCWQEQGLVLLGRLEMW